MSAVTTSSHTPRAYTVDEVTRSNERCAHVVRDRAKNFYLGMRLCPQPKRAALYAVYAWMRIADDIVDEQRNLQSRVAALDLFAMDTRMAMRGDRPSEQTDWLWPAFITAAQRYAFNQEELELTLSAMRAELDADRQRQAGKDIVCLFHDAAEFDAYCNAVAGVPGRLCLKVWGTVGTISESRLTELAFARGRALQRINIARDLKQDAAVGRVYVHQHLLQTHALHAQELLTDTPSDRHIELVLALAACAREALKQSEEIERIVQRSGRASLTGLTSVYLELLNAIESRPEQVFTRHISVPTRKKLLIAARVIARR